MAPLQFVRKGEPEPTEGEGVVRLASSLAGTHRYEVQTRTETVMLLTMSDAYPMDDELAEALFSYLDRHRDKISTPRRCG